MFSLHSGIYDLRKGLHPNLSVEPEVNQACFIAFASVDWFGTSHGSSVGFARVQSKTGMLAHVIDEWTVLRRREMREAGKGKQDMVSFGD